MNDFNFEGNNRPYINYNQTSLDYWSIENIPQMSMYLGSAQIYSCYISHIIKYVSV